MTDIHHGSTPPAKRALWLSPVPTDSEGTRTQRIQAHDVAARAGAVVVAEFLYSTSEGGDLGDRGWEEVLEFMRMLEIGVLVVLRPDAIARGFTDYYRRTESLDAAGVRLVLPDHLGLTANSEPHGAREAA